MGRNFIKYGSLLFFILFFAVTAITGIKVKYESADREIKPIVKNDSSVADHGSTVTHFTDREVQEYDNKSGNNSHSSLNSVNLIIYMIYQVTNKSLR